MTDRGTTGTTARDEQDPELYSAAIDNLQAVRALLLSAGRGELDAAQLESSLRGYWRDNGPAVRRAGTAAVELVRSQTLAQLYRWRAQLATQLRPEFRNSGVSRR